MLWLTTAFFFVEIVVGYITNSMALVADSFHMLSDVAALVVAFLSVKVKACKNKKEREKSVNQTNWAALTTITVLQIARNYTNMICTDPFWCQGSQYYSSNKFHEFAAFFFCDDLVIDPLEVALKKNMFQMSPKKWSKNTFGWARAEVLGALVNAVFLVALCFSITVEACKRFIEVEEIHDAKLLVVVGAVGLLVNLIGLFLFHGNKKIATVI